MPLAWRLYIGKLLNFIRFPARVNKCDYRSAGLGVTVKVEHRDLYTVITVNGLEVYFKRISGNMDGVGTSRASYTIPASNPGVVDLGGRPAWTPPSTQSQSTPESSD